jgi:hypothetical protein
LIAYVRACIWMHAHTREKESQNQT